MSKVILITGATDGIGLLTAKKLVSAGHSVLVHGRNAEKLATVTQQLTALNKGTVASFTADLSVLAQVETLAADIMSQFQHLDVIINNAGVYKTDHPIVERQLDVRFVVNTIAPYLLTKRLQPLMSSTGRVVNLSSAAQAPIDMDALMGKHPIQDQMSAYAQSKLGITLWTQYLAEHADNNAPIYIAINPGSLLASKMVKEGFGVAGSDLNIGADILIEASLSEAFANASGKYYDNDAGRFSAPRGGDTLQRDQLIQSLEQLIAHS